MIVIADPSEFCKKLIGHAKRKAKLYDGINNNMPIDTALRYLIEEVGEVATEISRDRLSAAINETIDVAYCAMLVCFAIQKEIEKRNKDNEYYL